MLKFILSRNLALLALTVCVSAVSFTAARATETPQPASVREFPRDLQGIIREIWIGEIDPFAVGDACLVKIDEGSRGFTTLVMDFDACVDFNLDDTYIGRGVTVARESVQYIDRHEAIAELKSFDSESFYVFVDFEAFENGLADD
ncbi:MAG TPA: hypothetical protein PLZ57_13460 [Pseudobdellovibrionaceae bacterium]|nr:hypothetical protein [Pseudobdellovibrionaceae bacterium]